MAGTDNHRNSGSRRVNMKMWGGVPSFNRNLSRHKLLVLYMGIELRVFKKKKKNMDKMGKTFLGIIFTLGALLLIFLVYCLVFTYKVP